MDRKMSQNDATHLSASDFTFETRERILQKWLDMALLDLQECKQTEAAALQQASVLLQEKECLKERLKAHLDLSELEKVQLEESFILEKRGYESKAVAQAFEIASLNIAIGFHQQQTLHFKLRFEGAVDDVENLSSRLQALSRELQEDDDKLCESNEGFLGREALLNSNPANNCTEKLVKKMRQGERAESHLLVVDELTKKHKTDIERLKSNNFSLASQRKQEVSALIREKNFVWEQLKRMEEGYCARLNRKGDELKLAEDNLLKLQSKVDELQKGHDEKTVEVTILKINLQMVEEELDKLREELSKLYLVGSAENNKSLCSAEFKPLIASTNSRLSFDKADGCIGDLEQKTDTLEIEGEQGKRKLQETVSQLPETTELVHLEEELKKTSKVMDELRLENQNLRMLYADLEVQQIGGQKSEKANRNSAKDVTSRNLAVELEAVANVSNHPHVKPVKGLKYVHRSKMERKATDSPMMNHPVMQKLDDSNEGMLAKSCVLNKSTETQFSSLRRQRGLRSSEKYVWPAKFETSKNKHVATAGDTKKVQDRFPTDIHPSTSDNESKCQTDPGQRKCFSGFPDKSKIQKRLRTTSIDRDASSTQMKIESHRGQSLGVCQRKILSPTNPNIRIQESKNGEDPREKSAKISLRKNRLFSSVFNIPKVATTTAIQ